MAINRDRPGVSSPIMGNFVPAQYNSETTLTITIEGDESVDFDLSGEDLPDLAEHEVEIARLTLADSVHGEVASLRARKEPGEAMIHFCLVDEYETEIDIPCKQSATPLSAEQVIECFRQADPCQTETDCEIEFQSFFYQDLNDVATSMGVK